MAEGSTWDILSVMQLSDSMFPAGTFAMSNGIESMHASGRVRNARELELLLAAYLEHQIGPSDCVAASSAHDHSRTDRSDLLRALDARCLAMRAARESRDAAVRSGTQLAKCVASFLDGDPALESYLADIYNRAASGVYPVSFGVCCNAVGMPRGMVAPMLLYGFVAGSVGAALRLGMVDHYEAQGVIHRLKPVMARIAAAPGDTMWQFCPQAEIAQMSHENLDSKMFIT